MICYSKNAKNNTANWTVKVTNRYLPCVPLDIKNFEEIYSKGDTWIDHNGFVKEFEDLTSLYLARIISSVQRVCKQLGVNPYDYEVFCNLATECINRYKEAI